MRLALLAVPMLAMATAAAASSDAAWAQFDRTVKARCTAASRLTRAQASQVIGFDDTLGKVAVLVSGAFPQRALRGRPAAKLCIYDQRTRRTWVSEADGWRAPAGR